MVSVTKSVDVEAPLSTVYNQSVPATAGNVAEPTPGQERMHGRWPEPRTPEPAAT
jgi:hypothetical protein